MMKTIAYLTLCGALLGGASAMHGAKVRTVTHPEVAASNTESVSLSGVELSDTATVAKFHVKYRPGEWIKISPDSRLVSDGKSYPVKGASGIVPDKELIMPESGEVDFTLFFQPLPKSATSADFCEGSYDGGWTIYGIDLTGKGLDHPAVPVGLPAEFTDAVKGKIDIEPVMKMAPTTIRFHLLGYRPEYNGGLSLALDGIGGRIQNAVQLDRNGNGELNATLYGTTCVTAYPSGSNSPQGFPAKFYAAPGETMDVYISPDVFGDFAQYAASDRSNADSKRHYPYVYTNGKYAAVNGNIHLLRDYSLIDDIFRQINWQMNTDRYLALVNSTRASLLEKVRKSGIPQEMQELAENKLNMEAIAALASADWFMRNDYMRNHSNADYRSIPTDAISVKVTPEMIAEFANKLDGDRRSLFMIPENYGSALQGLYDVTPSLKGKVLKEWPVFMEVFQKAIKGKMTEEDSALLAGLSEPLYGESARDMQAAVVKKNADANSALTSNPQFKQLPAVTDDKLFDEIMSRYKGKVVLVDLWNTWCGPCRAALKKNEPLKSGELSSDEIAWVYIADESSNLNQYAKMLPGIKGDHYLLNEQQMKVLRDRFGVDGIPYYILVDREGNATGRPDFRDHEILVDTLKGLVK